MLCYPKNYGLCFAYDLLMELKTILSVDEKSKEIIEELVDYYSEKTGVYTGEKLHNADTVIICCDDKTLDIIDEKLMVPLSAN